MNKGEPTGCAVKPSFQNIIMMVTLQCCYLNPYPVHFISSYFRICQPLSLSPFLMCIQHEARSRPFKNCTWDTCLHSKLLQLCLTLCDPLDCSPPGSSVHGILQTRILGGLPCPSQGGSFRTRDQLFPALAGEFFTTSATWEAHIWDTSLLFKDHKHEPHSGAC